jgi:hypothetical protein
LKDFLEIFACAGEGEIAPIQLQGLECGVVHSRR